MKNIYISILVLFIGMCSVTAQVGIGTTTPNENAVLDLSSTTQGMAFPRVADLTDISNPATGLMVFDMVGDCLVVNVGTPAAPDWKCTGVSILGQIGAEADNPNITNSVVTVEEINGIEGVSGAIPANETAYQDYIDNNPDLFSSPATVEEVNAMIAAVNNEASSTTGGALAQIGSEADDPDTTNSVVTASELAAVTGVTGVDPNNETAYQDYIDNNPDLFSSPATVAEVNAMIAAVNNEASSSTGGALAQIGSEADDPDTTNSVVTASELAAVTGVTGVDPANETAYQDYIDNNPDLFSSPATVEEVNAMIAAVNNEASSTTGGALAQIGLEADDPDTTNSVVTASELAAVTGVTGVDPANETAYQDYIDNNPDMFSSPATVEEVNAMIAAVNNEASSTTGGILAQIGLEADDPDTTNSVVTASELATVTGVTGVDPANETAYQDYIDNNPDLFSSPATVEEVNAMIAAVNNEASSTTGGALAQIGSEADDPDTTNSVVTASELAAVTGLTGVDPDNETAYQDYIDNNPDMFSSPATVAEVNAMIAAVNANEEPNGENSILVQIGLDADSGTVSSVTAAQLAALTGITGVNPDNEADYQQYIADNPDLFSSPATLAEVQAMIDSFVEGIPAGLSITTPDQNKFIASVYDTDYLPYVAPTVPATTAVLNADGTPEASTVDVQGVLGTLGSGDEITLTLEINNTTGAPVDYGALSQTVSVPSSLIEGGGGPIDVTLSYAAGTAPSGTSNLTVTIAAATTLNAKKLDMNAGLGNDNLGVLMAGFSLGSDGGASSTAVQVRILGGGIPDREFGDGVHDFMYLPVTSTTGEVWLNNNLGADYANINHASFNLAQQAQARNDHNAYGSLFQWGRYSDGHELINWTSSTAGTAVNGTRNSQSNSDTPGHNDFIIVPDTDPVDWRNPQNISLWMGVSGINNPCPSGYRVPTQFEWEAEINTFSPRTRDGAYDSNLKFPVSGLRSPNNGSLGGVSVSSFYWSETDEDTDVWSLFIDKFNSEISTSTRASGYPVRCIKN